MIAASAGFFAAVVSIAAQAQSGCVKEVFHKYCLGGDAQTLLNRHVPISTTTTKDGATQYVFADGVEQTFVNVVQGRIESVQRRQHPGVLSTFEQVERDLKAVYGEPRRVTTAKGATNSLWDRGDWRIVLHHVPARGDVMLTYRHETLQAARKAGAGYSAGSNPKGY
jgi:hypothetical protein